MISHHSFKFHFSTLHELKNTYPFSPSVARHSLYSHPHNLFCFSVSTTASQKKYLHYSHKLLSTNYDKEIALELESLKTNPKFKHSKVGTIFRLEKTVWYNYYCNNDYDEISRLVLLFELFSFIELFKKQFKEKYLTIMFKIKFKNGDQKSASPIQITSTDNDEFHNLYWALARIFLRNSLTGAVSEPEESESFAPLSGLPIGSVIFLFKPMEKITQIKYQYLKDKEKDERNLLLNDDKAKKNPLYNFEFNGYNIPATMDLTLWPQLQFLNDYYNSAVVVFHKKSKKDYIPLLFKITVHDFSITTIVVLNNKEIITILDESPNIHGDLSTFKRTINEEGKIKIFYFKSGELTFYTEKIKTKFIGPIKKNVVNIDKPKILTLDLETRAIQSNPSDSNDGISRLIFIPIVMSIYDGKSFKSFVFTHDWELEMMNAFKSIMRRKYHGFTIYTHNFSHFDSIFIIDIISRLGKVKPFMRNGKILKLTFDFKLESSTRLHTLYFKDSLLMLPNSLDKLSKSFNIVNKKSFFPHLFLDDPNITLDYKGICPHYKFFPKANTKEFEYKEYHDYAINFKSSEWVLKDEIIKYCENDTLALYQILINFRKFIHLKFQIDFTNYATIPSLAFAIYRSNFLESDIIPIILPKLHRILKQSYYGGITEIYKSRGHNIKSYDVNSLYPDSMKRYPMPSGQPTYINGDIRRWAEINDGFRDMDDVNKKLLDNDNEIIPYGFYNVKVITPSTLDKPFLPTKFSPSGGEGGLRTIYPIGEWSGWYFSEEIINAMKYGYRFEFKEGYLFEKTFLFNDYIDVLYDIKTSVDKHDPWYYISKLLMNSLYGRFGLNPEGIEVLIVPEDEADKIIEEKNNVEITPLLSKNVMISYDKSEEEFVGLKISLPISSAIAAYSRVTMSHFMMKYSNNLYYIDTDGIKLDVDLDDNEVDNKKLGKMKFEYAFSEFIGIAPKAYGGIIENNDENNSYHELVKLKGYKSLVPLESFKDVLLRDNKLEMKQRKWTRDLSNSRIVVNDTKYTLSLTESKRELVYDPWHQFIGTVPFKIKDDKRILTENRNIGTNLYHLKYPHSLTI